MSDLPEPVKDIMAYVKSQRGRPYIWGGIGPAGYDSTGWQQLAREDPLECARRLYAAAERMRIKAEIDRIIREDW